MQIIGHMGLARSGKTTLARMLADRVLEEEYGIPVVLSFAGPLKKAAALLGADKETSPAFYRTMCQHLGDWLRNFDSVKGCTGEDFFVDLMKDKIKEYNEKEKEKGKEYIILIDDVRFSNEVQMIEEVGGLIIYCDASERGITSDSSPIYQHISEQMAVEMADNEKFRDEIADGVLPTSDLQDTARMINSPIGGILTGEFLLMVDEEDEEEDEDDSQYS